MVLWYYGIMVLGYYDIGVLWYWGNMVLDIGYWGIAGMVKTPALRIHNSYT